MEGLNIPDNCTGLMVEGLNIPDNCTRHIVDGLNIYNCTGPKVDGFKHS